MNMRRTTGALMIAALALLAGACSSDSKSDASDSKKTTTTVADDSTTTTAKPLSDEEYTAAIAESTDAITGAGNDLCAVSTAIGNGPPPPGNSAQVKSAVDFYAVLLNAFAHALPAENAAQTQALETAAASIQTEAEAANYPADFFTSETGPTSLATQEFTDSMSEVQSVYSTQCEATSTTEAP